MQAFFVIPAKAGTHPYEKWVPAFAGIVSSRFDILIVCEGLGRESNSPQHDRGDRRGIG